MAILGNTGICGHLAAIEVQPRLKLVRHCSGGGGSEVQELPRLKSIHGTHDAMLADGDVRGVALCTAPSERLYWARRSATAGKHVLVESPVVSSYRQGRDLAGHCRRAGTCLAVVAPPIYSELASAVKECEGNVGRPLYFHLTLHTDKEALAAGGEGVLLQQGVFAMVVLTGSFGHLDSVYARTRSLVLNRAAEDIAVAQLRFQNGLEGSVEINGLESGSEMALRMYGTDGATEIRKDLACTAEDALRVQYESFVTAAEGGPDPEFGSRELVQGLFLLGWLNQSARQDREVYRREVEPG
jgi:predicted dehydrogenase